MAGGLSVSTMTPLSGLFGRDPYELGGSRWLVVANILLTNLVSKGGKGDC